MKKSIKHIFNTLLLASSLALISCNNLFQDDEKLQSVNTINSENKVKITANVDLENNSRKAVPEDYSLYDRLNYKLIATCNTDDSYSTEMPFDDPEIELELVAANWSFELTAYDAADTPILRSSENTNIDITEDTELNFKMVGLVNGSLEYKFLIGEFTEEDLEDEELDFTNQRNPVLVFEFYKYKGSIQETLLHKIEVTDISDLVITEDTRETYEYNDDKVQMIEIPITIVHRKDSFSLPEGTYFVICKKADRNEDESVNEETVTEDNLSFFFQELVEIKAGLTTKSGYDNINSASPEYKITLHTNGGSFIDIPTVDTIIPNEYFTFSFYRGKRINQVIPEPKKVNNVFQGWFYDSELTKPFENPYGDGFPISNNNVEAFGNAELYAKWVPINGERPEVLLYTIGLVSGDSNGRAVKSSSDWNTLLDPTYSGKQIVDTVSNNGNIYSLQRQSDNTIKLLINDEEKDISYTGSPVKIAVDSATNIVYILISDSSDNFYKKYTVATYADEVFLNVIFLGNLSERGVCKSADVKGFAVHNGQIWLNFVRFSSSGDTDPVHSKELYENDDEATNDYINLLYICTLNGYDYEVIEKQTPDFLACLNGELSNLKKYSFITDFAFKNNKVYATVKTSHYSNKGGFYDPYNLNTPNGILYFGGIIEIDPETLLSKSLFAFNSANIKTINVTYYDSAYDRTETKNLQYMGVNSQRDTTCLAGPTKILAIKEKELIMVDEGAFVWVDGSKGYHTDVNRIVVFDLQNNSIKYVCPINGQNIKFAEDWSASSGTVPGFVNITSSVGSLFSD